MDKKKDKVADECLADKQEDVIEDEDLAGKKNDDWWRLEKFQMGRRKFP